LFHLFLSEGEECVDFGFVFSLQVSKAPIVNRLYFRVLEDIRYVMSHLEVAQHVAQDRLELARTWLHLLAFVQGMYPQRRITNMHVEEESEEWGSAYLLEVHMAPIHPLFVAGAAASGNAEVSIDKIPEHKSQNDLGTAGCEKSNCDLDASKPAKVGCSDGEAAAAVACSSSSGRTESDVEMYDATSLVGVSCCPSEVNVKVGDRRKAAEGSTTGMTMSGPLTWLISECTQVLATWLALDSSREIAKSGQVGIDISQGSGLRRGVQWRGRGWDRGMNQNVVEPPPAAPAAAGEGEGGVTQGRGRTIREWLRRGRHFSVLEPRALSEVVQERSVPVTTASTNQAADMDVDVLRPGVGKGVLAGEKVRPEWWMGVDVDVSGAGFGQLFEDDEWPVIDFDVSRQEVSYHIPLHRMLGLLLHKVLELYSAQSAGLLIRGEGLSAANSGLLQGSRRLLAELFPARFQVPGFAAALMEHPLRLQVLCAQVQAGMWRRNGHSTSGLCDLYHTVHWWVLWMPSILVKAIFNKSPRSGKRKRYSSFPPPVLSTTGTLICPTAGRRV
jgi:E3 ubiquitin-protein ligase UBR3